MQSSAQKERSSLHGLLSLYAWKILEMLGTWHQQKDVTLAFNALAVHYTIHVFLRELNLSLATLASDPCHFTLAISNGKKTIPQLLSSEVKMVWPAGEETCGEPGLL